jgi:hypothetical protein
VTGIAANFTAATEAEKMKPRPWDAEWAGLGEQVIALEALERLNRRGILHVEGRSHEEHFALACLSLMSRVDDARRFAADMQSVAAIEQRARAAVAELERMRVVDQRRREALASVVVALERVGELLAPS